MKKIFALLFLSGAVALHAQTLDDIEMFNISDLHGTPRFVGMGGAFTSLGNDLSSVYINPAAAAVYRKSTVGLTLGFQTKNGAQSNFFGGEQNSSDFNLPLENIGLIRTFEVGPYKKETKYAFGLTYQRIADFNRSYSVQGINNLGAFGSGSLAEYWLNRNDPNSAVIDGAVGLTGNELSSFGLFEELAAFQTGILVESNDTINDIAFGSTNSAQTDILYNKTENGSHNELGITFGGEYQKNFYYGISIGIPVLSYRLEDRLTEFNLPTDTFPFDATSYSLNRTNEIYATGINLKLGFIYNPAQWWRIGGSYQSPSWYGVNQVYEFSVNSNFSNGGPVDSEIFSTGEYTYGLRTPSIYRAGTSVVLAKRLILSADYEYADPSESRTYDRDRANSLFDSELVEGNNDVSEFMTGRTTIRLGGEFRTGPIALRGGYVKQSSFYNDASLFRGDQTTLSGGIGLLTKRFDINITYARANHSRQDLAHPFASDQLIETDVTRNNFLIGANFRF
jgi:hypothetical protein